MIFGTRLVEVGVVDAHPQLPVSFRDDHRIGEPLGVAHLSDKASILKPLHLFSK